MWYIWNVLGVPSDIDRYMASVRNVNVARRNLMKDDVTSKPACPPRLTGFQSPLIGDPINGEKLGGGPEGLHCDRV